MSVNVFNTVYALRPDVAPMPLAERSRIRESLFGVGHGDATRSVRARSESGAVVSTAPHGTRANAPRRRRRRSLGPVVKAALGLAALVAGGVVAWSFASDEETGTVALPAVSAVDSALDATIPVTTIGPPARTPVTPDQPLLVPAADLAVDEITISPPAPGTSSMLVRAPDGTTLWLGEFDGELAPVEPLDFQVVGSIDVGVARDRPADASAAYQLSTPCGLVVVNDAPGTDVYRPEAVTFFESMTVGPDSTLDASFPAGFSIVDAGVWQTSYAARFAVPDDAAPRFVRLVQIPNGSIAQLTFGGRQLTPTTFGGQPAFVDSAAEDPNLVSIFWKDADTSFNVSSTAMDATELESFVSSLEAASPAAWLERFSAAAPPAPSPTSSCTPQPSLGPTLVP